MTTQPEALRIADELDYLHGPHGIVKSHPAQLAAAELRRLHAENDRLTIALKKANDQAEHFERRWYLRGDLNDELLEALTALVGWEEAEAEHFEAEGPDDWLMEKARAAIANATGEQK